MIAVFAALVAITVADPYSLKDDLEIAKKYAKLIEQYGEKAWHFLECMGIDWAKDCVSPTLQCVETRDIPGCIALIECEGKDAIQCASNFN